MQTAYIIHMSEGPSIRRVVTTRRISDDSKELEITVTDCNENWAALSSKVFTSTAGRRSWKRGIINGEPSDAEAIYHFNMRRQLYNSYQWRFELHASYSDPLR